MADPNDDKFRNFLRTFNPNVPDKELDQHLGTLKGLLPTAKAAPAPAMRLDPRMAEGLSKLTGVTFDPDNFTPDTLLTAVAAKSLSDTGAPIRNMGPSAADREKSAQSGLSLAERMARGASPEFAAAKARSQTIAAVNQTGPPTSDQASLIGSPAGQELIDRQNGMANDSRIQRGELAQRLSGSSVFQAQLARRNAAETPATRVVNGELLNADGSPLAQGRVFVGDVTARNQAYLDSVRTSIPGAQKETMTGKLSSLLASNLQTRKLNTRQ